MSKSLFFNALPDAQSSTGYDRNYNADDLSDFLSIVCDTGVVKTDTVDALPQGLRVVSASGMSVSVKAGKAVINGKAYINDTEEFFTVAPNGTASTRYDFIVVKYDNNISARTISLEMRTGTSARPTVDTLNREGRVYELMLAIIAVAPSAGIIAQSNITDTRGDADLCPWFTAVKGYDDYYDAIVQKHESTVTLSSISATVITDLPSTLYNERYSIIDVYTNGIKEAETAYTVTANGGYIVVTFAAQKGVGTKVTVILSNFIDGEGLTTALAQYSQFVQDITALKAANEINYICSGVNDNIAISQLVQARLNDSTAAGDVKINIIGNIGMSSPVKGTGVFASPYVWFDFTTDSSRNIVLDFSRCKMLSPSIPSGTFNYVFYTKNNISVNGVVFFAYNTAENTVVRVFAPDCKINEVTNSNFLVTTHKDSFIASSGTFTNCQGNVSGVVNNAFCFDCYGALRINGGTYYAYTGGVNANSAVVGVQVSSAVCIMYGVNAPTRASNGTQTNSIFQTSGYVNCRDLISVLPLYILDGQSTVDGTIPLSKP